MAVRKIGIVPVALMGGEPKVLIHLPRPKYNRQDAMMWGLARGTRQYRLAMGPWQDMQGDAVPAGSELEPAIKTAWREMQEELGIERADVAGRELTPFGQMDYRSPRGEPYPVQWFACRIAQPYRMEKAMDAQNTRWVTLPEIKAMAARGEFKEGYLPVLEQVMARMQPVLGDGQLRG